MVTEEANVEQERSRWREAEVVDIAYMDYFIPEEIWGPVEGGTFSRTRWG